MPVGNYNDQEFYGVISGPIIQDKLAFRALAIKRDRDGLQDSISGADETNSTDDQNLSLALTWNISDNITMKMRGNDRESDRVINAPVFITEGPTPARGVHSSDAYAYGLRTVGATDAGALAFSDPVLGTTVYGAPNRPGVDSSAMEGIRAIIQPGGSVRDEEVIAAADEHDIAMVFTKMRHFLH